ncbi:unnamed protein product [Pedinophyceae sp. YPF-701]|nr:unnamed protein product [Pedinophyceae sp. YPF-701]
MPLVVVCGQPSCGKTTVSQRLAAMFRERIAQATPEDPQLLRDLKDVVVVDEPSLHMRPNEAYADMPREKMLRGAIRAEADGKLNKRTVVIVDSVNGIKGFRYELWCVARAAATRHCCVHVDTPSASREAWNAARVPEGDRWLSHIFDDLSGRFERPDGRNRWDSPLITVYPEMGADATERALQDVVAALTEQGNKNSTRALAKDLRPTMATSNVPLSSTNLLHELDRASQEVVERVASCQGGAAAAGVGGVVVSFGEGLPDLALPRTVTMAELRRHKRFFLKAATQNTFSRLKEGGNSAKRVFLDYLARSIT